MLFDLTRLPPGGSAISAGSMLALLRSADAGERLRRGLMRGLAKGGVTLHASGREALRIAFAHLSEVSGRREVIVPAYSCFSIPAAAVAAGLRVRLVDTDLTGQIDSTALQRLPLEAAAAVVVANLFGVPEPVESLRVLASEHGVAVVDDAAQALGARSPEGPVGARGELGVLSFGRGKPLSALGGGALLWPGRAPEMAGAADARAQPGSAMVRATVYDLARLPLVFRALAAVPSLGIGATVYDPSFPRGGISGSSLCLAAALLETLDESNRRRARRAESIAARLGAETPFTPLLARAGCEAIYPRLALLAPDAGRRDAALERLKGLGVTAMYPTTLDRVAALRPHLAGDSACSVASEFCARLLTVPVHRGLRGRRLERLLSSLGQLV